MKKALLLLLVSILSFSLLLTSCGKDKNKENNEKTPCVVHQDVNKDNLCDNCQADVTPPCNHADSDSNDLCDKCGAPYSIPKIAYTIEIKDADGNAMKGLAISLLLDSESVFTATTDDDGKVSGSLKAGNYYLMVEGLPLYWATDASFSLISISESKKSFSFIAYDHSPNGTPERPYPSEDAETGEGTEVSIPAGETYYFNIKGSARYLIINAPVTVGYMGTDYLPENGKVKLALESTEDYAQSFFTVTNTSDEAVSVKIEFEAIKGTAAAPFDAVLDTPTTATVKKGVTVHYSFTATASGTLTASSEDTSAKISFYNTTTYVGETDKNFAVNEGDTIIIYIESTNTVDEIDEITFTLTFN